MDFKKAFTFMFKDDRFWINALIGTLIVAVHCILYCCYYQSIGIESSDYSLLYGIASLYSLFMGLLFFGYQFLLIHNCNNKTEKVLPDFVYNIKSIIINGGKLFFNHFIFSIIFSIAFYIVLLLYILISLIFLIISKPLGLILLIIGVVIALSAFFLFMLLFMPALVLTYVDTQDILAFFNFKRAWKIIKTDLRKYFINLMSFYCISLIYTIITVLVFIIGITLIIKIPNIDPFITKTCFYGYILFLSVMWFFIICIYGYLLGQVYKNYKLKTQA